MKYLYKVIVVFLILLFVLSCKMEDKKIEISEYPDTRKEVVNDDFFGTTIEDPYRWLEDDRSGETEEWVKRQNSFTEDYLEQIPFKNDVHDLLNKLYKYDKYEAPVKSGQYLYYMMLGGTQNQPLLYRTIIGSKDKEVLIDPNSFSQDGISSIEDFRLSQSGKYIACRISVAGTDWSNIVFFDTENKSPLEDTVRNVKFGEISWYGDEGLFYSKYDTPTNKSKLTAITSDHKLYYHKLGTEEKQDKLVFGGKNLKRRYVHAHVSHNQNYLIIYAAESTSGTELYLKNLQKDNEPVCLVNDFKNEYKVVCIEGNRLILYTSFKAPNGRLVAVDLKNPDKNGWVNVVPETEYAIEDVSYVGGSIFVNYLKDVSNHVAQYNLKGEKIRDVKLPEICTVEGFKGDKESKETYFLQQSFTEAPAIYRYQIESGEISSYFKPTVEAILDKYKTTQVFYKSKDGTQIPMFIVANSELEKNSSNPTLLYGYGGFNISETPRFDIRWLAWLEMGGALAKPNLRGGGEYGKEWHKAGMQFNKQNVFDDFIAAAEYLQKEGYTSPEKLTIFGRSNGGLLVGATMTQRPNLMKVALPVVGVLDMLRFHQFTAGAGWISDYGCADSSRKMFEYIHNYSPVHNVQENVEYPATMVATGDHDDRVVPAHSFKFISHLQDKQMGKPPVLIRIDVSTGHGSGKPSSKYLAEIADLYTFAFYNMSEVLK